MSAFIAVLICMIMGGLIVQILRAEILFYRIRSLLSRADLVLGIIEGHGRVTDAAAKRVEDKVEEVKRDTRHAVEVAGQARDAAVAAPEKMIERLAEVPSSVTDASKLPTVKPPAS